ncbi:VSP [Giardia lamblia P15]|uniref:VSP n=1 Tax=Giardia intestinalis (strain P15) TaxID=658858 RepID=E1F5I0_GIAIA|nr:VSP [Giardia lamblia P15]
MFGRFIFTSCILQLAWIIQTTAAACTPGETGSTKCKTCDAIIGTERYCSECDQAGEGPINGVCTSTKNGNTCDNKVCTQCAKNYFLYKGGCYKFGEAPGNTICEDAVDTVGGTDGVCTTCKAANGFFKHPVPAETKQSCIACNETVGVVDGDTTYKGTPNCLKCNSPSNAIRAKTDKIAVCTLCDQTKYLKEGTCVEKVDCGTNMFGKPSVQDGNKCIECGNSDVGIESCAECTVSDEPSNKPTCTKCAGDNYLKTTDEGTSCIHKEHCTEAYFPNDSVDNKKQCVLCGDVINKGIADCTACNLLSSPSETVLIKCSACMNGKKPNEDGSSCIDAPEPSPDECTIKGCQVCSEDKRTCDTCQSNNYLTPTKMCISDCKNLGNYYAIIEQTKKICKECTMNNCKECAESGKCEICNDGFYLLDEECKPCNDTCKTCEGGMEADKCTSCKSGSALIYAGNGNTGTCSFGCTPKTGTDPGSCKACDLTIDGTRYCSVCNVGKEYPQNGACAGIRTRASSCQDGNVNNGVCSKCEAGFFLMDGGCYEITKYPGKTVCTKTAADGTCETPAPGFSLVSNTLKACFEGCAKCVTGDDCSECINGYVSGSSPNTCEKCSIGCAMCYPTATTCTACLAGYYKSGPKCIACDKDDSAIKGISNCLNCAPPSTDSGSVLCYLMKGSDSTGGSTNKSGLSTGAIAGIAVAVVVVVGGLVGFLCWWFLCRGKA